MRLQLKFLLPTLIFFLMTIKTKESTPPALKCSEGTYLVQKEETSYCLNCKLGCKSCDSKSCTECYEGYQLDQNETTCLYIIPTWMVFIGYMYCFFIYVIIPCGVIGVVGFALYHAIDYNQNNQRGFKRVLGVHSYQYQQQKAAIIGKPVPANFSNQ